MGGSNMSIDEYAEKIKSKILSLTKMAAGKMSKSENYEMADYVQLEEVLKIIEEAKTKAVSPQTEEVDSTRKVYQAIIPNFFSDPLYEVSLLPNELRELKKLYDDVGDVYRFQASRAYKKVVQFIIGHGGKKIRSGSWRFVEKGETT
jgi:hypothetical protein